MRRPSAVASSSSARFSSLTKSDSEYMVGGGDGGGCTELGRGGTKEIGPWSEPRVSELLLLLLNQENV